MADKKMHFDSYPEYEQFFFAPPRVASEIRCIRISRVNIFLYILNLKILDRERGSLDVSQLKAIHA